MNRIFFYVLEFVGEALDRIPRREDGRWYSQGCYGCLLGICHRAGVGLYESERVRANQPGGR